MKKFRFRLEKVLAYKTRLYDIARNKHAAAVNTLRCAEAKLESLRETYKNCLFELAQKTTRNFRVRDLGPYYRYMTFIKREIANQSRTVVQALKEEEQCRKTLMARAKEKDVLTKLRDKQYSEYRYALDKEEQKFLDGITVAKFAREIKVR